MLLALLVATQATTVNLDHHWTLDDAASPAVDAVGTLDGVWTNGPTRQTTELPPAFAGVANLSCLSFDGTNDFVQLGTDLALVRNAPAVTLAGWVRIDTITAVSGVISIAVGPPPGTSNDSRVSVIIREGGLLRVGVRAADADAQVNLDAPAGTIVAGEWAHVAAVVDYANDTMRLYKNGNQVAATTTAAFTPTTTSDTNAKNAAFGANDTGGADRLNGRLDDLRIYGRALTVADVRTLCTPAAPLTLDAQDGTYRVTLTWTTAPDDPTVFNVYRSTSPTTGFTLLAGNVTGTSYVDTTAPVDADSYYVVTAVGVRESAFSPVASGRAQRPPPRLNDHEEGLLEDNCACGASAGGAPWTGLLFALLAAAALHQRAWTWGRMRRS